MKQRLLRLVLIGPVLSVLMAGLLLIFSLFFASSTFREASLAAQMGGVDLNACIRAPNTWGWRSGDVSTFAYDRSGRSANPNAPAMDEVLIRRAKREGQVVYNENPNLVTWAALSGAEGPCAVLRGTARNPEKAVAPRFFAVLASSILGGMLLAAGGTVWFILRPLRDRIDGLASGARAVGSPAFAPQPAGPDALGYIAEVLTQSHVRLVETQKELEQRNRALEEHLAGIAHDLRTPLSSMHLALEAVAAASDSDLHKEARRALADVVYLSSMVENLHQAARLRHELDATSERVELSDLVRRLERRFAIVGRHAGIEVAANTPEEEVWVACNHALAERAVSNLVQNAVEHNTDPGHVAIKLSVIECDSSLEHRGAERQFELLVVDDGPGIPQKTLASLQKETFLVDEARPRGPGMGMLIVSEVARRAGWSLSYQDLKPSGLQVRMTGPVAAGPN